MLEETSMKNNSRTQGQYSIRYFQHKERHEKSPGGKLQIEKKPG